MSLVYILIKCLQNKNTENKFQSMQKSHTSSQGFYIKKKQATRNYQSVNVRVDNKTADNTRLNESKTQIRNTASMYISKNRSTEQIADKTQQNKLVLPNRSVNTAQNHLNPRQNSKSAYRYKKLNFSSHKQPKYQNYTGTSIQDFRRKNERQHLMTKIKTNENLTIFLQKVQILQIEFVNFCLEEQYDKAAQIIIQLLNYTVDLNLVDQFTITLKVLADFYIQCGKINQALFYYNQTRESALLLDQAVLLIQSLIGIAKCCSKGNLQKQAISILKKALEYSWFYENKELQLHLYDEMGQKYYHLGELQKAKKYHLRYVNSIYESSDSAHKSLSKQRIKKSEEIHIQLKYQELSILFLVHLKIPIRSLKEVPPMEGVRVSSQNSSDEPHVRVRDNFNISKKYFSHFQDMESWVRNILKTWFFAEEMDEPPLPNEDWTAPVKMKKFAYIDFKLNQHLKKFNNTKVLPPQNISKDQLRYKQSLQEKIERKLKEPPIENEWYEKMVQQIVRDHKNKLLNVRNAVRMRGYNKPARPPIEMLKQIYNRFFQKKQ